MFTSVYTFVKILLRSKNNKNHEINHGFTSYLFMNCVINIS